MDEVIKGSKTRDEVRERERDGVDTGWFRTESGVIMQMDLPLPESIAQRVARQEIVRVAGPDGGVWEEPEAPDPQRDALAERDEALERARTAESERDDLLAALTEAREEIEHLRAAASEPSKTGAKSTRSHK